MAGHHQIWTLDLDKKRRRARTPATAGRTSATAPLAPRPMFAQPSGLATDGKTLYVADSEVSAIRAVPLNGKRRGEDARRRGPVRVRRQGRRRRRRSACSTPSAWPTTTASCTWPTRTTARSRCSTRQTRECKTFLGGDGGWLDGRLFNEPAGLSFADGKLYVADTNAHRIRVVDLKTKAVTTLKLQGRRAGEEVNRSRVAATRVARRALEPRASRLGSRRHEWNVTRADA